MIRKAAVVIGVDQTGNLAKLKSAAAGADAVAGWLKSEGYDVICLTDKEKPVTATCVEEAISQFVKIPPQFNLLLVYFSGHGYWHARNDLWLLSGAPIQTSQAINLGGAMELAKFSGISNIIFISDACRSIPDSRTGARVNGIDAFPNFAEINQSSKIDFFKATTEAQAAFEVTINDSTQSVLTYAIRSAYENPKEEMINEITEDNERILVVPNRKLESYLQDKINDILSHIDITLTQTIEVNVPSSDDIYIARAKNIPSDFIYNSRSIATTNNKETALLNTNKTLDTRKIENFLPTAPIDDIDISSGFIVSGAKVIHAITPKTNKDIRLELIHSKHDHSLSIIKLENTRPGKSVLIQTESGRTSILAGLDGYIGHAVFNETGLANVSYIPAKNNWRWGMYVSNEYQLDKLRALVALEIQNNTFKVTSNSEAEDLAYKIRVGKGIDPTLGLYAAYAYWQAGKERHISSVRDYMLQDLNTDLFDIQVLLSRQIDRTLPGQSLLPFCPLLTQTWSLLRPRGIKLHPELEAVAPYLCNSLWTTFEPKASDRLINAIETGDLK